MTLKCVAFWEARYIIIWQMKWCSVLALVALGALTPSVGLCVADSLLVHPKGEVPTTRVSQALSTTVRGRVLERSQIFVVKPGKRESLAALRDRLIKSELFEYVVEDTVCSPLLAPNDPLFSAQWNLSQIMAPRAWDFSIGSAAPIVAVVDTGVDLTHPDLAGRLVPGYNSVTGLTQDNGGSVSDIHGHGTFCSGIVAANGNNGIGVSGVGWNMKVMPIKASEATNGDATLEDLLEGAEVAASMGAKIVSVSYSGISSPAIETTGAALRGMGVNLVWAAGNDNADLASFDWADVTIVGATTTNDVKASFSAFGRAVDCYAPGTGIRSTSRGGGYGIGQGTSYAAPTVAGALALIADKFPTLTADQREKQLFQRSRDLGVVGEDSYWGWGRINLGSAVENPIRRYHLTMVPMPPGVNIDSWGEIMDDSGRLVLTVANAQGGFWHHLFNWGNWVGPINTTFPISNIHGATPMGMNNQGVSVGLVYNLAGQFAGFYGDVTSPSGFNFLPSYNGNTWSQALAINENGEISGSYKAGPGQASTEFGFVRMANGTIQIPAPNSVFGPSALYGINNQRQCVGQFTAGPYPFYTDGTALSGLTMAGYSMGHANDINESGKIVGYLWNSGDYHAVWWDASNPGQANFYNSPAGYCFADHINDRGEVVGREYNVELSYTYARVFEGLTTGRLQDLLDAPLPTGIVRLGGSPHITNGGIITGTATTQTGLWRSYIATPVDPSSATVTMGQLGLSPTYVGSIPPTLSVSFTSPDGTEIPGSSYMANYNASTGHAVLAIPASVAGDFRLRLRMDSIVAPSYQGCPYLSRLYPPLSEPPFPRDTYSTPLIQLYQGDVDGSGEIDAVDIDGVIVQFGTVTGEPGWVGTGDVDGSGEVDAVDIDMVIANFGLVSE